MEGPPAPVMKAVHRALGPTKPLGNFARSEASDVPEDQHLTLGRREFVEREPQRLGALHGFVFKALIGCSQLLERDRAPRPQVIERGVSGHPQDPRRKWNVTLLVALDLQAA